MTDSLIVLGGSAATVPILERARALGLRLVVVDADKDCPGAALAHKFVAARPAAVKRAAVDAALRLRSGKVSDVLGILAADPDSIPRQAELLGAYGLPALEPAAAARAVDKLAQKIRLAECGVRVPSFREVKSQADLPDNWIGGVVLKPRDGRGALRLGPRVNRDWAIATARQASATGQVIAERWVDGPAARCVVILSGGRSEFCGCAHTNMDRIGEYRPRVIVDGWTAPYEGHEFARRVALLVEGAAKALEWRDGLVTADVVQRHGDLYLISLDLGLPGHYLATHVIPLAYGLDLGRIAIDLAAGLPARIPTLKAPGDVHIAQRHVWPAPDDIGQRVYKIRKPVKHEHIFHWALTVAVGDEVRRPARLSDAWGCVIAHGPSADKAELAADRFCSEMYASVRIK